MNNDISNALALIASIFQEERSQLSETPILSLATPSQVISLRQYALPEGPQSIESVIHEATSIFTHRVQMNHPRFFGFIPAPTHPLSWIGEILTSLFNTHAGSWFQSSGPSAIEASLISFLAAKTGLPTDSAGGVFVSGGSMANLTALMMARDQMLESQEERMRGVVYVSDQTHLSVARGLRVLGFMDSQIRKVPTDSMHRLDVDFLREMVRADRAAALLPFIVVASCGTTNTGSVDPLSAIANFAQQEKMWMHVDGAYGASIVLSNSYGHLADGLGRADSISWDAHKWLFQTYACGIVLARNKKHLSDSFATDAEYVRDAVTADETPNFWNFGVELTRPARAMKLWFTMRVLGSKALGRLIDHGFSLAERAEVELQQMRDWEILSPATLAIVVFRYAPFGMNERELDELNITISRRLLKENIAGVLTTKLQGKTVLRICAVSPELSLEDMTEVIAKIDETARSLL